MNHHTFIEKLIGQLPSEEDMKSNGIDISLINEFKSITNLKKRQNLSLDDELLCLVANYNADIINIADVIFNKEIAEDEDYFFIGKTNVIDLLVIDKTTKEIQTLEDNGGYRHFQSCAKDGAHFLDALLLIDFVRNKSLLDDGFYDNQKELKKYAYLCTDLAGGDKYFSFCSDCIGYFDR